MRVAATSMCGDYYGDSTFNCMKHLDELIRSIMQPLSFWSPEAVHGAATDAGLVPNDIAGARIVSDALRGNPNLVRLSDGRYALATGILAQGPLTARCVEVLTALGGKGRIEDICLFVPENAGRVSNALSGNRKLFRRIKRGYYALRIKKGKVAGQAQVRRSRHAITDAVTLADLDLAQRATLALINLGRPATVYEVAGEFEALEFDKPARTKLQAAMGTIEGAEMMTDGNWRLTERFYSVTSHAERLELALACFRRPALSRELSAWMNERGWAADAKVVKDAHGNSKKVQRLAKGIYGIPSYFGAEYEQLTAHVLGNLAQRREGDTLTRLAKDLRLTPELVEVILRTSDWVSRRDGVYIIAPKTDPVTGSNNVQLKDAA